MQRCALSLARRVIYASLRTARKKTNVLCHGCQLVQRLKLSSARVLMWNINKSYCSNSTFLPLNVRKGASERSSRRESDKHDLRIKLVLTSLPKITEGSAYSAKTHQILPPRMSTASFQMYRDRLLWQPKLAQLWSSTSIL